MLRGFRERWEVPIANIQRALDRGVLLMDKTINYIEDVQRLTTKASRLLDRVESLVDAERELKRLEAEKLGIEIEVLRLDRERTMAKIAKNVRKKG